jgi:hypothetical protein
MSHKFSVGQTVDLIPRMLRAAAAGKYEVVGLMPILDNDPDNPRYRIKSLSEKHERVVSESELVSEEDAAVS